MSLREEQQQRVKMSMDVVQHHVTALGLKIGLPIIVIELYLSLTLLTYLYGPWRYPLAGMREAAAWALAYQVAIALGYIYGVAIYRVRDVKPLPLAVTQLSILATLLMFFPTSMAFTGNPIPNPIAGLANPGELYSQSLELAQSRISIIIQYMRIALSYLLSAAIPLILMNWSRLTNAYKWLAVIALLSTPLIYVSAGINKGVGEALILLPFMAALILLRRMQSVGGIIRAIGSTVVAIVVGLMIFLPLLGGSVTSREGAGIIGGFGYFPVGPVITDPHHPSLNAAPDSLKSSIVALTSYGTQGYYAMSMAVREDFTPMYGFGNSMFLTRQVERLPSLDHFGDASYPAKIERYGWDRFRYWSTAYLWWASDVGFFGVILICFGLGLVLSLSWQDFIFYASQQAFMVIYFIAIVLIYISGNNQVGQSGESLVASFLSLMVWLYSRSRLRIRWLS